MEVIQTYFKNIYYLVKHKKAAYPDKNSLYYSYDTLIYEPMPKYTVPYKDTIKKK